MTLSDQALDALLKRLHLANTRRAWRELTQRAEQEEWTYRDLLALVVSEEIAQRQQTRVARLVRRARFPFLKTIDDFNFLHQSTVRLSLLGSALASEFVTEGRCVILSGKPGRGKTHLAVAIAYRAIQNGFDARFVTAAELIDDLSSAFRRGQLAEALGPYVQPSVLVVDEVGYLTYGTDAANMLFHVVNDRHRKKRAMVFTTNKALSAWGHVLHDDDLAQAILDRILERGRLLTLDGPSMRTKHLGLDDPTSPGASDQPARISGIQRPEFPEPTLRQAQSEKLPPLDLVSALVADELQRRQDRLLDRRHKLARFRDPDRSLDTFDFDFNKKMNRALIYDLATARFITQREDVLFLGPPGTGKSHLAQALGRAAIQQGYRVIYREAHTLLEELAEATLAGTRKDYLTELATVPLLIIDDLGMRKLAHTAAEDLLELIMRRYERASTLLTSNRPVDDWGKLLGDTAAVTALLDRLLHHAHVLKCGPRSWRTKVHTDLRPEDGTK